MNDLPIRAFLISGYSESIELTINKVYGFPNETSYGGGYGAKGTIEIHSGNYQVKGNHYFTTGELFEFNQELKKCYKEICGKAELKNTERELELIVSVDFKGHVVLEGNFQERADINNILSFEIECDQSCLLPAIKDLENIEMIFGGMEGKRL